MTINFSIGDWVLPNETYYKTLKRMPRSALLKQTLGTLGALLRIPCEVMATGNVPFPSRSYIRIRPADILHPLYKKGFGITIYFLTDELLNDSFESSQAFLADQEVVTCLNNTGGLLSKNQVVRQIGFDATQQLPTIGLADATSEANSVVLGILQEDVADGATASILLDGSFQYNTTGFTLGSMAYLSNTPGAIATAAGTVSVTVGRVLSVAVEGTISLFSVLTGGGSAVGGGGGGGSIGPYVVENKTSSFTITAADDRKIFVYPNAPHGLVQATADAGLPVGSSCRMMFMYHTSSGYPDAPNRFVFQPESGGRVIANSAPPNNTRDFGYADQGVYLDGGQWMQYVQFIKLNEGWSSNDSGNNTLIRLKPYQAKSNTIILAYAFGDVQTSSGPTNNWKIYIYNQIGSPPGELYATYDAATSTVIPGPGSSAGVVPIHYIFENTDPNPITFGFLDMTITFPVGGTPSDKIIPLSFGGSQLPLVSGEKMWGYIDVAGTLWYGGNKGLTGDDWTQPGHVDFETASFLDPQGL